MRPWKIPTTSTMPAWPMPGPTCRPTRTWAICWKPMPTAWPLPTPSFCCAARPAACASSWKCSSPTWTRPPKGWRTRWWYLAAPAFNHLKTRKPHWARQKPAAMPSCSPWPSATCATPSTTTTPACFPAWWPATARASRSRTASSSAPAVAPASWKRPTAVRLKWVR